MEKRRYLQGNDSTGDTEDRVSGFSLTIGVL